MTKASLATIRRRWRRRSARRNRETVSWGREILGGNGIVADYNVARFFADAEALYSYEGTYQMQNLIVGKAITGHGAFL
jgi:alkylation response protein AidB-like acyl-CoA dehydrogenase